jgi:iron(III) transport system substrate-binding protein
VAGRHRGQRSADPGKQHRDRHRRQRGPIDAGLVNHYYLYERGKEEGVPADQLDARHHYFPGGDIGAMVNVSGVGVLTHSAEDQDALAFVDYLLSEEGQRYFAEETSDPP